VLAAAASAARVEEEAERSIEFLSFFLFFF